MAVTSIDKLLCYTREHDVGLLPLASPTTQIGAGSLSGSADPSIGFTFYFDGVAYTTYHVRPYGFVRLAGTLTSANNANLFSTSPDVLLAPWYDGLRTAYVTGYVKTEVQGSAPWRRHVVEWACHMVSGHSATNNDTVTFQCVLYETTNRVEYRYGPRVRTGSPTGTVSASIGLKGDTSVVSTNRRDLWVFALALGGSSSATTANLTAASYDALAERFAYVIEPAYPMCGRFLPVGDELLSGIVGPDAEPLRSYANNVNWHYCHHTPAAANWLADLHDGVLQSGMVTTVVPFEPSQDALDYLAHFTTYNDTSTTLSLKIWESSLTSPRWDVDADWTTIATDGKAAVSGWQEWDDIPLTPSTGTTWLRIQVEIGTGDGQLVGGLIHPEVLDEPPTSPTAIGWTRMGLGLLVARANMPVGPEYLNRLWTNTALVMRDRKQVGFAGVRPIGADYEIEAITPRPARPLNHFPMSLVGQGGATLEVRAYAASFSGTGYIHVRSSGGGTVTLTVPDAAGAFTGLTASLEVIGEHAVITAVYEPPAGGSLQIGALVGIWTPGD